MSREVSSIASRLSLRPPQRISLKILHRIAELINLRKDIDTKNALDIIQSEFDHVKDFERDFPSLCFALATGVGKTRLMGAFITYLYQAHGIANFFVLAPSLTIYNKLIADFTPNTPKYVFTGISDFAINPPLIITGDNYNKIDSVRPEYQAQQDLGFAIKDVHINIFNISKINSEVRGGKEPKIKRLSEYIGQSYFDYLAELKDLVLIMDESHRYRASAGIRAINELKPILGLELTATPYVESGKGPIPFQNVIYNYPLAKAMEDGFVKEPAVITQKDFNPKDFSPEALEEIKLKDGVSLHEYIKVELETYARQNDKPIVKPFMLIIARDTTHATKLMNYIQSDSFFDGRYREKVIQVDSSVQDDEMVLRLLNVEKREEPTEIVIHVNMLKEGWDVTNLYTIVPLRAANARTLIEQSIGRGLRLPYGKRTGEKHIDRLNIVAHDKFQEIVDEANRAESVIHLAVDYIDFKALGKGMVSIQNESTLDAALEETDKPQVQEIHFDYTPQKQPVVFHTQEEKNIAKLAIESIRKHDHLESSQKLNDDVVQKLILEEVKSNLTKEQLELPVADSEDKLKDIIANATTMMIDKTIDIPRILVVPKGEVTIGYYPFVLDCNTIHFQPVSHDLVAQLLRTNEQQSINTKNIYFKEARLEDHIVKHLIDYDDICYDEHADLLYELAKQIVNQLRSYMKSEDDIRNVMVYHQKQLSEFVHAQMQAHQYEKAVDYEIIVSKGFTPLKKSAFTARKDDKVWHYQMNVEDKNKIPSMLFGGFTKCLYDIIKFQSNSEKLVAGILERDSQKWLKPAMGQFQIQYKTGITQSEYVPDFVAEDRESIYMIEVQARKDMAEPIVLAKKDAGVKWCHMATEHNQKHGGKKWVYALIPHDEIAANMSLSGLVFKNKFYKITDLVIQSIDG